MISLAFRPRLVGELATTVQKSSAPDLFAGITVGIIAIPLAMAFAIASGVAPEQGLVTAVITGIHHFGVGGTALHRRSDRRLHRGALRHPDPVRLGQPDDLHDDGGRHPRW